MLRHLKLQNLKFNAPNRKMKARPKGKSAQSDANMRSVR